MKGLAINGGGIRGVLTLSALSNFEKELESKIIDKFDYVSGTSTGGIIATALVHPKLNYASKDVLEMYVKLCDTIFKRSLGYKIKSLDGYRLPKYPENALNIIDEIYGDVRLGEVLKPILITSYDIKLGVPVVYESDNDKYKNVRLSTIAKATSTAPTYFYPVNKTLIDGGVYANNPSLCLLFHLIKKNIAKLEDINLLSFGTGYYEKEFKNLETAGSLQWIKSNNATPIVDVILDASIEFTKYGCTSLLNNRYLNCDIKLDKQVVMDSIKEVPYLIEKGVTLWENKKNELLEFITLQNEPSNIKQPNNKLRSKKINSNNN
jgi:patatin-like phospholipase/acyl hydrolase